MTFWKALALCAIGAFGFWVYDAQQTGKARAAQRTVTQAADDARQAEVIRRGAVIRSERKFDDFTLRTIEMPKKTEFGTELVTCFLFDSPHAATIACQEVGEPVF